MDESTQAHFTRLDTAIDLINAAKDETGRVIHLSKLADGIAAAIKAGEQRGRVAGMREAAALVCPDCRNGVELHRHLCGAFRHHCHSCSASHIHALIAEEAAHVA